MFSLPRNLSPAEQLIEWCRLYKAACEENEK
jgi:hypothetical protein